MAKKYNRSNANRGKQLERLIDMTNNQYRNKNIADVRQVPTPVQIMNNNRGRITGFIKTGEWVDYVGIYDGRSITFDAKETALKNFPFHSLPEHQYDFLKSWHEKGALSFLVISFSKMKDEIYLLPFKLLEQQWEIYKGGGRKSIPHNFFVENCDLIKSKKGYVLHYLDNLDKLRRLK